MIDEVFKRAVEIYKKIEDLESKIKDTLLENEKAKQGIVTICIKTVGGQNFYIDEIDSFTETLIKTNVNKINNYNEEIKELRKGLRKELSEL